MRETLTVNEGGRRWKGSFCLIWLVDGDQGLRIGESDLCEDWDFLTLRAHTLALESFARGDAVRDPQSGVFYWQDAAKAHAVLRHAKALAKADEAQIPLPQWAQTALSHGWKPPRGWKPSKAGQ